MTSFEISDANRRNKEMSLLIIENKIGLALKLMWVFIHSSELMCLDNSLSNSSLNFPSVLSTKFRTNLSLTSSSLTSFEFFRLSKSFSLTISWNMSSRFDFYSIFC